MLIRASSVGRAYGVDTDEALTRIESFHLDQPLRVRVFQVFHYCRHRRDHRTDGQRETSQTGVSVSVAHVVKPGLTDGGGLVRIVELVRVVGDEHLVVRPRCVS